MYSSIDLDIPIDILYLWTITFHCKVRISRRESVLLALAVLLVSYIVGQSAGPAKSFFAGKT